MHAARNRVYQERLYKDLSSFKVLIRIHEDLFLKTQRPSSWRGIVFESGSIPETRIGWIFNLSMLVQIQMQITDHNWNRHN